MDDLVTDKRGRSAETVKAMFGLLTELARKEGCDQLCRDSAVWRHKAHRFYLKDRVDIGCFHFVLLIGRTDHAADDLPQRNSMNEAQDC